MPENQPTTPIAEEARGWLAAHGKRLDALSLLTGDVSPRSYARIQLEGEESAILAIYPSHLGGTYQHFLETTGLLSSISVPVPAVLLHDKDLRFMLLQDLGSQTLFELPLSSWDQWCPYFEVAIDLARRIGSLSTGRIRRLNPLLDAPALEMELEQTWRTYLEPQGMVVEEPLRQSLRKALAILCNDICEGPLRPCHRDFMARNLIPMDSPDPNDISSRPTLAVIDHQDLRLGPETYDVASLLNDSLFPPPSFEQRFLEHAGVPEAQYRRTAVQRTLKAVGTYASFAGRGVARHLPLIPPTLERALYHMDQLPELMDLASLLRQRWRSWLP